MTSTGYRPKHIPTASPTYRSRSLFLSDLFQGRIFDQLEACPLRDIDQTRPGEAAMVGKLLEEDGWTQEQVLDWFVLESVTNRIDWIVDKLLDATSPDKRKQLAEVPVRVTDTQAINVTTHRDGDKLAITVDRGLVAFADYMLRLINIEVFRPSQSEFLYSPPSHGDVLGLLRDAGAHYHAGRWSAGTYPISRVHFRQAINSNLMVARTGALLFLIAHEYGHVALGHLGDLSEVVRGLDGPNVPIILGEEIQADHFAVELALSAIAGISPHEIDRSHLEVGIFLFLFGLSLAEVGVLLDLHGDLFDRTYFHTHSTGLSRATRLMREYGNRLARQTPALALEYANTTNSLADELRKMEGRHG